MNHYYLQNRLSYAKGGKDYMLVVLYKDNDILSIELLSKNRADDFWDFCQDIIYGSYTTFDYLSDFYGEDRAASYIDDGYFMPCWEKPNEKLEITLVDEPRFHFPTLEERGIKSMSISINCSNERPPRSRF